MMRQYIFTHFTVYVYLGIIDFRISLFRGKLFFQKQTEKPQERTRSVGTKISKL